MAITSATADKQVSRRFVLLRLEPARVVTTSLVSQGGGVYSMTWPFPNVAKVQRNGTDLTLTPGLGGNDDYDFDAATGTLRVQLASAPNASSNVVVAFHWIFYASKNGAYFQTDPGAGTGDTVYWDDRITGAPSFRVSVKNALSGVVSIEDTAITLINHDAAFQAYLGDSDSFANKECVAWMVAELDDGTREVARVFTGRLRSQISIGKEVRFVMSDALSQLQKPAFMGDDLLKCIMFRGTQTGEELNMATEFNGTPRKLLLTEKNGHLNRNAELDSGILMQRLTEGEEAVPTAVTLSTWMLCRLPGGEANVATNPGTQPISAATFIGEYIFLKLTGSHAYEIGDTFKWEHPAGSFNFYFGVIVRNTAFTYLSTNYDIAVWTNDPTAVTSITTASDIQSSQKVALSILRSGEDYPIVLREGYDYGLLASGVDGDILTASFISGTYVNAPVEGDRLIWRVTRTGDFNHADVLQAVLEAAGFTVASSTFSAAESALSAKARFTIPYYGENTYGTYLDYVEGLLASTLGVIYMNELGQVAYKLLDTPSSSDVYDHSVITAPSCEVDYFDIVTKVKGHNPHVLSQADLDAGLVTAEATSNESRYLHGVQNEIVLTHYLDDISGRIAAHLALRRHRRATYTFQTGAKALPRLIMDDVELSSSRLLGGASAVDTTILSLEVSPSGVTIQTSDLKGL